MASSLTWHQTTIPVCDGHTDTLPTRSWARQRS